VEAECEKRQAEADLRIR